jgi:hypothetical protein
MKGKDITIPKGTEITAYTNGEMRLDIAKFRQNSVLPIAPAVQQVALVSALSPAPMGESATLQFSSTPSGADVSVDGKFIGNTPSTTKVSHGDHEILIELSGFKPWKRVLSSTPGATQNIAATLEAGQ